jgi:hypothetical protein
MGSTARQYSRIRSFESRVAFVVVAIRSPGQLGVFIRSFPAKGSVSQPAFIVGSA